GGYVEFRGDGRRGTVGFIGCTRSGRDNADAADQARSAIWLWALTDGLITGCLYHHLVPSCTQGWRCWPRWVPLAVLAAIAAPVLTAGCAASQTRPNSQSPAGSDSLDSVEIDDSTVSLPKTQHVTCVSVPPTGYLFSWTGSNQLVPRRPLEETETSS